MIPVIRAERPRLFRMVDDTEFQFAPVRDPLRRRILRNMLRDCRQYAPATPPTRLAERLTSPHPFHQLYITFYEGMRAQALIEQYAYAWKFTGEERWLDLARRWLRAACRWEHSDLVEEHFYTANRYMNAFAVALDVLHDRLTDEEKATTTACLLKLLRRWWPDVDGQRDSAEAGHHAIIDNAHFGLGALALLGEVPEAESWVAAVVQRARKSLFAHPCGSGGAPWDGPFFWGLENMWRVQFAEALRNVTGIDLFHEFWRELTEPLQWLRYHLPPTGYGAEILEYVAAPLLYLARLGKDHELCGRAIAEPRLGRIRRYGIAAKGSSAECLLAWGPYAYLFCDPGFKGKRTTLRTSASRFFSSARGWDDEAVLRDDQQKPRLIALVNGVHSVGSHGITGLQVSCRSQPVFKTVSAAEYQQLGMGTHVTVGGCVEAVGRVGAPEDFQIGTRATLSSPRTLQEFLLLRANPPILLVAARIKPRQVKLLEENGWRFVRLEGADYLQYVRRPWFLPDEGSLRMTVRFPAEGPRRTLFHAATAGGLCAGNSFLLGFRENGDLFFELQSQMWHTVSVTLPGDRYVVKPGAWHEIAIRWGGLNDPAAKPFIELGLNGRVERQDDPAVFGELKSNAQGLTPHAQPRTFYCRPNTCLAFGARVQIVESSTPVDIARIELCCPGCPPLEETWVEGLAREEAGSGPLAWCFTPAQAARLTRRGAEWKAGSVRVALFPLWPKGLRLTKDHAPYAPLSLAAGSLKRFRKEEEKASTRIWVSVGDELVVILGLREARQKITVSQTAAGLTLVAGRKRYGFAVRPEGPEILSGI